MAVRADFEVQLRLRSNGSSTSRRRRSARSTTWYFGWMASFTVGPLRLLETPIIAGPTASVDSRSHRCACSASSRRGGKSVPSLAARFRSTCRGLAHARNGRADRGMLEDEPQRQFRQVHALGDQRLEALDAIERGGEVVGGEVDVPEVALRPDRVRGQRAGQAAFVERHARDDGDAVRAGSREQLVFRRLVEDVVDDLHGVDRARSRARLQDVRRLPAVDADADRARPGPSRLRSSTARCQPSSSAQRVAPHVKLLEIDRVARRGSAGSSR